MRAGMEAIEAGQAYYSWPDFRGLCNLVRHDNPHCNITCKYSDKSSSGI